MELYHIDLKLGRYKEEETHMGQAPVLCVYFFKSAVYMNLFRFVLCMLLLSVRAHWHRCRCNATFTLAV